jgi:hypothetical protein
MNTPAATETAAREADTALAAIAYLLEGTAPTQSEADTAIRKALTLTATELEHSGNFLNAQRQGLDFLRKSLTTPAAPRLFPPRLPK